MQAYLLLFFAIIFEITATTFLKLSYGFSKLIPSIIVIIGYGLSFWLLSLALKTLPVNIVYAIWSGLGILGIAFIGSFFFKESFGIWNLIGTLFILIGVAILSAITKH